MTQPPREITSAVARHAWGDPLVRFWWLVAAVLMAIGIYNALTQYLQWSRLDRSIRSGVTVEALVDSIQGSPRIPNRAVAPSAPAVLMFEYQGKKYQVIGAIGDRKPTPQEGQAIPIRIDPNDPTNWTIRDRNTPLLQSMIGAILPCSAAVICGLVAWFNRAKLLKTYRLGRAEQATVTDNKQSPLAPRSRAVRCSLRENGRLMEVFVPHARPGLSAGDKLWVILPPSAGRPVAAEWFDRDE